MSDDASDTNISQAPVSLGFLTASRKGTVFAVAAPGQYRFGRDPECEIHLPEVNVSRVHARLNWDGSVLSIEDLKSTNGVFVNGERVPQAVLRMNDVVAVGPCVFRVHLDPSAISDGAAAAEDDDDNAATAIQPRPDDESGQFQSLFECMLAIQRIVSEGSDEMVEQCLETLWLALPVTRLCLLRVGSGGELEPWLTRTKTGTTREFVMSKTFARKVKEANKGILLHDALLMDSKEWGHTMQQQEVRSILGVPVFDKGTMIAILLCDNLETPNILRDMHVRTLEFFARALETVFYRERILRLEASQAANEREFIAAKRVQKQIFTKKPGAHMGAFDWAFLFRPALHVGGDFYDFALSGDDVTWVVADVTGKGIPAALVVSMLKGFCKTLFQKDLRPRDMLIELNRLMLNELPPEMFLTAMVTRCPPDGTIISANAGHLPLLVARPGAAGGTGEIHRVKPHGVPLGFLEDSDFCDKLQEITFQLEAQDRLLMCTDGVTEAANTESQFFGEKRVIEELLRGRELPVAEALGNLVGTVEQFQGTAPQHDDITLVVGRYCPAPA